MYSLTTFLNCGLISIVSILFTPVVLLDKLHPHKMDNRKIVNNIKPDILNSHYATSYGLFGRVCNFHPFIISVWGSDINEFSHRGIGHKKLLKYILSGSDTVCATSYSLANETKKYYMKDITITPFGVDLKKFTNNVPILNNKYITIGISKNLEKIYGIDILIHAFSKLIKKFKTWAKFKIGRQIAIGAFFSIISISLLFLVLKIFVTIVVL